MATQGSGPNQPGSGLPNAGGTEPASRSNLGREVGIPPLGAGDPTPSLSKVSSPSTPTSPAPLNSELALRPRGADIKTGGCGLGDERERGTAKGSLKSGAPLSSSLLIAVLTDHRNAIRQAIPAIEEALRKLHIEDRYDLAMALAALTQAMRGGAI